MNYFVTSVLVGMYLQRVQASNRKPYDYFSDENPYEFAFNNLIKFIENTLQCKYENRTNNIDKLHDSLSNIKCMAVFCDVTSSDTSADFVHWRSCRLVLKKKHAMI